MTATFPDISNKVMRASPKHCSGGGCAGCHFNFELKQRSLPSDDQTKANKAKARFHASLLAVAISGPAG
jgi:Fe-S cluster assembly iron-binding protein IscA